MFCKIRTGSWLDLFSPAINPVQYHFVVFSVAESFPLIGVQKYQTFASDWALSLRVKDNLVVQTKRGSVVLEFKIGEYLL